MTALIIWLVILGGGALAFDLIYHRKPHPIGLFEASAWSIFYIGIAVAYGGLVWFYAGPEMAQLYFTGYILEKALSVDNLFVFGAIFAAFKIAPEFQHRILHFGILGAIFFRGVFVALGVSFLHLFEGWAMLLFAGILAYVTWSMVTAGDDDVTQSWYYRWANRAFNVNTSLTPVDFFPKIWITASGQGAYMVRCATVAVPCLITIELADVMFAFDSVPAVIAVSKDPLIIVSAMLMAILGLRALYFVLGALKRTLPYLETAVIFILGFISLKMFLHALWSLIPVVMEWANMEAWKMFGSTWLDLYIEPFESFAIIVTLLSGAALLSLVRGGGNVEESQI